jgi:hypothetical protein
VAGCGSSHGTTVTRTAARVPTATVVGGSAGSCAAISPAGAFRAARLVLTGTMLRGPSIRIGKRVTLISPARVQVIGYLKGHGPRLVTVRTAIVRVRGNRVTESEDAIMPVASQRWKLYLTGRRQPYDTSICLGSAQIRTGHPGARP